MSAVILSAGIIAVYQPLLSSISGLHDAEHRLAAGRVLSEQLWLIQSGMVRLGRFPHESPGAVTVGNKAFYFGYREKPLTSDGKLYSVEGLVSWQSGSKRKSIKRTVYAGYF